MNTPKNISASVKARLQNVAATRGEDSRAANSHVSRLHGRRREVRGDGETGDRQHPDEGFSRHLVPAQRFEFDGPTLRKAIDATFARRQTNLPPLPEALTDAFANNPTKQVQWAAFLRRNGLTGIPERFSEAVAVLRKFFEPVLRLR